MEQEFPEDVPGKAASGGMTVCFLAGTSFLDHAKNGNFTLYPNMVSSVCCVCTCLEPSLAHTPALPTFAVAAFHHTNHAKDERFTDIAIHCCSSLLDGVSHGLPMLLHCTSNCWRSAKTSNPTKFIISFLCNLLGLDRAACSP